MFFYRAWLISGAHSSQPDYLQNQVTAFDFAKWIYLALLVATILVCSGLNFAFLISFIQNGMGGFRKIPNVVFICMSLRDLIVCAVLIPICIDWYVIENGVFAGGFILCKFTGFLDYWMLAQYPILIIVFGVILLTRKFPKPVSLLRIKPIHWITLQLGLSHGYTFICNLLNIFRKMNFSMTTHFQWMKC